MAEHPILYQLPMWGTFALFAGLLLVSLEIGFRLGLSKRELVTDQDGSALVQNSALALLGLVLAFTYSVAMSRYETRKQAVISEANALGTAFLRAGLLRERGGTELQRALLDYAHTRDVSLENVGTRELRQEFSRATLDSQAKLWPATDRIVHSGAAGLIEVSLISAVNDVIDMHTIRLAAAEDFLPPVVFWTLIVIAGVALAIGAYTSGLSGRMCRWRLSSFALVLAAVMFLIADLDRPTRGFIQVSQQPLHDAIAGMEAALPKAQ